MCKNDFVCGEPMIHCCGGYSEHNNCCPHNFHHGCSCGLDACGFLLHATHELEESLDRFRSRLSGDENTIAENYEKCSDAIENISTEQQELRNTIEQIIAGGASSGSGSGTISIPTKVSQLTNDLGFITEGRLNSLVNSVINSAGYITRSEVQEIVQDGVSGSINIPTKLSQLTNDLGFVTEARLNNLVNTIVNGKDYVTESRVRELLQAAGLNSDGTISLQLKNAIDTAGFVTQEELAQALLNAGYTTSSDIQQALQNAGYATLNDMLQALLNADYATRTELQQAIQNAGSGSGSTSSITSIKVGNTTYSPSDGVISLPAYPTSLPSSDVSAWAKASTKPSYTYPEIGYTVNPMNSSGGSLSLDGTKPLHVVNLTGNVSSLTLSSNPAEGHSCHVIFSASAEQTVVIAHDATNRICPNASDISLTIPAGGYVEIDFLMSSGKVYVRGV